MTAILDVDDALTRTLANDPDAKQDPHRLWRQLRETSPIHRLGDHTLVLTRLPDVKDVLRADRTDLNTKRFQISKAQAAFVATLAPHEAAAAREYIDFTEAWLDRQPTAEENLRLRRIAQEAGFTPKRLEAQRPHIEDVVGRTLTQASAEGDTYEFMRLAYQIPLELIVDMLGFPAADRERIHAWTHLFAANIDRQDVSTLMPAVAALREFRAYVDDAIEEQLRRPARSEHFLAALLAAEDRGELTRPQLAATLILQLFAGHETFTTLASSGLWELHRQGVWRALVADPSLIEVSLSSRGVDELARLVTPVQAVNRAVARDHALGELEVCEGDMIIAVLAAANRDPEVFAEPDRLWLERPNANQHVGFGFGPHHCLGAALARLEAGVLLDALAHRFPDLELACDDVEYVGSYFLRQIGSLPISFGRDRGPRQAGA